MAPGPYVAKQATTNEHSAKSDSNSKNNGRSFSKFDWIELGGEGKGEPDR